MSRLLPDWISGFIEHTTKIGSPPIFRQWAAISAVAGALQRRVWTVSYRGTAYPHLYIILVGAAASGKTQASTTAMKILRTVPDVHLAPDNISRASMMDALASANVTVLRPKETPPLVTYNSMTFHAEELGVLIPAYDQEIMAHLTRIYDVNPYTEHKRGNEIRLHIENPQINLLADCTPSYLAETLPETAWEQGFMSRCCLVYSGELQITAVGVRTVSGKANGHAPHTISTNDLKADLKAINQMYGELLWEDEAAALYEEWHNLGGPPRVTHPRLQSYNGRRSVTLQKLCMISSVSRGDDRIITVADYQRALGWLLEMEHVMPDIFLAMTSGGDAIAMRDTWDYVLRESQRMQAPVAKSKVLAFISHRIPAHSVVKLLDVMVDGGQLVEQMAADGRKGYKPGHPN